MINKVKLQEEVTEILKFKDFNISPNILHVYADAEYSNIALLH